MSKYSTADRAWLQMLLHQTDKLPALQDRNGCEGYVAEILKGSLSFSENATLRAHELVYKTS